MFSAVMFHNFSDWLEAVGTEYSMSHIEAVDSNTYELKIEGCVMAYWDRQHQTGAVAEELI